MKRNKTERTTQVQSYLRRVFLLAMTFALMLLCTNAYAMRIFLSIWTETYMEQVEPTDTILSIKEIIEGITGIPPARQNLAINKTLLEDDYKTLEYYHIPENETLVLIQDYHEVTIEEATGGSVAFWNSAVTFPEAAEVRLKVTPSANHMLKSLSYTPEGGTETAINAEDGKYSFLMPDKKVTVKATFWTEWSALQDAIRNAGENATIKASDFAGTDKTITAGDGEEALKIYDKNITLDLTGCTIDRGQPTGENADSVMRLDGKLTIKDTSGGGKITGGTDSGIYMYGGTLILNSGTITGNRGRIGGGVCIDGSFTMNGGSITGNSVYKRDEYSAGEGGGVYIGSGCSFTMTGGSITDNSAERLGGGVHAVPSSNVFEMTGGKITNNTGGGVCIEYGSGASNRFKISGNPTVSGNSAKDGTADNVAITTTVNPIRITNALTGGAVYINNIDAGVIAAQAEGGYTITESDASRLIPDNDSSLIPVVTDGGRYVVFKKEISDDNVAITPKETIYNGDTQNPAVTVKMGGVTLEQDKDYTVEYIKKDGTAVEAIIDAGEYTIRVTGAGRKYTGTVENKYTVGQKPVTVISGITSPGKTYDGTTTAELITTDAVIEGTVEGDEVLVAKAEGAYKDAGAGAGKAITISVITLGGKDAANYTPAEKGRQKTTDADIVRREIRVRAKDQTVELNGKISSEPEDVEVTVGSLVSGQSITAVNLTADTSSATDKGTIALNKVEIRDAQGEDMTSNYDISMENGVLTVKKADAKITAEPKAKTDLAYSGTAQDLITAGTASGGEMWYALGENDRQAPEKGWSTAIPTGTEVQTYYVWYKAAGDENHNDTQPVCIPVSIFPSKHQLTIRYIYEDGRQAAESYTNTLQEGSEYVISSPTVEGWKPDKTTVSGTMGDKDVTVTVTYTAVPAGTHLLTICYVYENGKQAAKDYSETLQEGADYTVKSPAIEGYTPDQATVSGTMGTRDVTVTVIYAATVAETHRLTIKYVYNNGKQAAKPHEESLAEGAAYAVKSPAVEGHTPDKAIVSGTMGTRDVTVTVSYKANLCEVTFKANGGEGTMDPQQVSWGKETGLKKNAFTRAKQAFSGWNTAKDGSGTAYADKAKITLTGNIILYAQWEKTEVTVNGLTYSLNPKDQTATVTGATNRKTKQIAIPDKISANGKNYRVTVIKDKAFMKMKKLEAVTIGANVKKIGTRAFVSCPKLKKVNGGTGVTMIGIRAFASCPQLKAIPTFRKLQTIGQEAFKNDKALEKVTIGSDVRKIHKLAFYGCGSLNKVKILSTHLGDRAIGVDAFENISPKVKVSCPKGKLKTYKKLLPKKGMPGTAKYE